MWWLIFCVSHRVPRSNIISGYVWRCFQIRLVFESMYSVKQTTFPNVVGTIQSLEGLNRTREEQGGIHLLLLPHTARAGTFHLTFSCLHTSNWNLHHQLSWLSGLQTRSQTELQYQLSWVSRSQTAHLGTSQPLYLPHSKSQLCTPMRADTHTYLIGSVSLENPG